jgi:hypothetical protein
MQFTTRTYRRWVRRLALGLAVASFVAPAAAGAAVQGQASQLGTLNMAIPPSTIVVPVATGSLCPGDPGFCVNQNDIPSDVQVLTRQQYKHLPGLPVPVAAVPAGGATVPVVTPAQYAHRLAHPATPVLTQAQYRHLPGLANPVDPATYNPGAASKPTATPTSGPSFDWSDAGIGIAIGAGLVLLLGAGLAAGRRRGGGLAGA